MAEQSYPFDAAGAGGTGGQASVLEGEWQRLGRMLAASAVITQHADSGGLLAVTANGASMAVTLATGVAWVEGFVYRNDASATLTIGAADATNPRIDTVVLRLDRANNNTRAFVKAGTPAASPVPPTLTQTDLTWELPLADVRVNAAVGTITAGNVTDRRALGGPAGPMLYRAHAAAAVPLRVVGAASQTGALQTWESSTGVVQAQVDVTGVSVSPTSRDGLLQLNADPAVQTVGAARLAARSTSDVPLTVWGKALATADLFQVYRGSGIAFTVDSVGTILGTYTRPLSSTNGSSEEIASFAFTNTNTTKLQLFAQRTATGSDHTTATLSLRRVTDVTVQQSLSFPGNGDSVLAAAAVTPGKITLRPGGSAAQGAALVEGGAVLSSRTLELNNGPSGNSVDATAVIMFRGNGIGHMDLAFLPGTTESVRFQTTGANYAPTNGYHNVGVATLFYNGLTSRSTAESKSSIQTLDVAAQPRTVLQRLAASNTPEATKRGAPMERSEPIADRLRELHPVTYRYKQDDPDRAPVRLGFVAEELAVALPEVCVYDLGAGHVSGTTDENGKPVKVTGPKPSGAVVGYDLDALVTLTVATVQTMLVRIDSLEAQLAAGGGSQRPAASGR